ncbi:MAG: TOBE domain-containing protein [Candidatus Marinarcus sp.]|uniref:TOBE domain-containing protein n=1 Tax=Candidatus Marinarcus sp. TaxID=3100987 RepID=UPI003B00CDB8
MRISARNQLEGVVELIQHGKVNAEVYIKLKSGYTLVSVITNDAVKALDLQIKDEVIAIIKSSSVLVTTDMTLTISARNKLQGVIENILLGEVSGEVCINVGNNDTIVSVITANSIKKLNIKMGNSISAIIKATDVIIGK